VTFSSLRLVRALCVLGILAGPSSGQRWQLQYFHDERESSLTLTDLQFASPSRGIAVGVLDDSKRQRPVALVTSDGGAKWDTVQLKENPVALYLLNESIGWLVTDRGLWVTDEAGRNWRKLPKPSETIQRVYFANEKHGWAACSKAVLLETDSGGERWKRVEISPAFPGDPKRSVLSWIVFSNPMRGIAVGANYPPERSQSRYPEWVDPEESMRTRERPHLSLSLETFDGGKTWKPGSVSALGTITKVRFHPSGVGLGLIEYSDHFLFPSEVYRLTPTGISSSLYRDKNFVITDTWISKDGTAYISGSLQPGDLRRLLPGVVQVLASSDMKTWTKVPVDYRAVAKRTMFASSQDQFWMATDTGMILKLVP
jgi:hypothetical protein